MKEQSQKLPGPLEFPSPYDPLDVPLNLPAPPEPRQPQKPPENPPKK